MKLDRQSLLLTWCSISWNYSNTFVRGSSDALPLSRARIQHYEGNEEDKLDLIVPRTHLWTTQPDTEDPPKGLSIPNHIALYHPQNEKESQSVADQWKATGAITKTGTTIVGVRTADAVVLAADTRATEGSLVADTTCEKLQRKYSFDPVLCQLKLSIAALSNYAAAAGAGTAADLYHGT